MSVYFGLFPVACAQLTILKVKMYIEALGGPMFWSLFALATIFECIIEVLQPWILGQWANQYLTHRPEDVNVTL